MKVATPALTALERAAAHFITHSFSVDPSHQNLGYGKTAAEALGIDQERVFKTLLVESDMGPIVGIVPVNKQLSMKAIAVVVGAKHCQLLDAQYVARISGYVVGGVSPFGQKRLLPTIIDETALLFDTIFVSGGRRGLDVEVAPSILISLLNAIAAAVATS